MKKLSFVQKLILLVGVPLIGLMAFGVRGAQEKYRVVAGYARLEGNAAVMGQMNGNTQQRAAADEELSAQAAELTALSGDLHRIRRGNNT